MKSCPQTLLVSFRLGQLTGYATALATAMCGQVENGNAVAPLNAISHIVYGDAAFTADAASLKYTMTGLALNNLAHGSWAAIYEFFFGEAGEAGNVPVALLGGAAVASAAYITDYYLVPKRFTPGFEKHLSGRSLFAIYLVLALCLGVGGLWCRKRA